MEVLVNRHTTEHIKSTLLDPPADPDGPGQCLVMESNAEKQEKNAVSPTEQSTPTRYRNGGDLYRGNKNMVMIKTGNPIVEIEGQIKGDVYRKDNCGQHIQAAPRKIKHVPSWLQKRRQRAFRVMLSRYLHIITHRQRVLWQQWTFSHPRKSKKGKVYFMPPHMAYLSVNINRYIEDLPLYDDPPP